MRKQSRRDSSSCYEVNTIRKIWSEADRPVVLLLFFMACYFRISHGQLGVPGQTGMGMNGMGMNGMGMNGMGMNGMNGMNSMMGNRNPCMGMYGMNGMGMNGMGMNGMGMNGMGMNGMGTNMAMTGMGTNMGMNGMGMNGMGMNGLSNPWMTGTGMRSSEGEEVNGTETENVTAKQPTA